MSSSRSTSPFDKLSYGTSSLRRLLPASNDEAASEASVNLETSPTPASSTNGPPAPRRKRQATTAACRACRKRKSKCDGARPTCSVCRDRKTKCEFDTIAATETHTQALKRKYTELQQQKTTFEQIYEVLRSRPEKEAEEIFQRIRRGADANSILRHVNYGDVLVQLALVPETRFRYEFPYLPDMPIYLQIHDNPYLDSEVFDCALRRAAEQPPRQRALPSVNDMLDPAPDALDQRDPYLKPYSSAIVVDPCLDSLTPSNWTLVSSDDNFMRQVIHDYFLYDYDWFTFFHKDYFLQDMASGRPRYCSRLLVNAILCIGCYCHQKLPGRSESWNPKNIGNQFLAEAKRLFELETEVPRPSMHDPEWQQKYLDWECRRLTTIHAALLLNVAYNLNGSDRLGWRFTIRAMDMANEIQLFQTAPSQLSSDMRCVRDFTAWCLFIWQSLSSYHYLKPPLMTRPPDTPLPDPSENPQWWGELWIRYPQTPARLPTYHGHLMKARANFWTIMNDFSLASFSQPRVKMPLEQVVGFYNRLRAWLRDLPEPLTPKRIVLPHHLKLHMHYNCVLIDLLKPLLGLHWGDTTQPHNKTLDDAQHEAALHLETLLRLYYLRHGFEAFDGFLLHFLGSLNFIKINTRETQDNSLFLESHRSTMLLLMKGIRDQSQCHTVAKMVLRLQAHLMRSDDVALVKKFVDIETARLACGPESPRRGEEEVILSDWPVYEVGLEAKAEQKSRGVDFASMVSSVTLEGGGGGYGEGGGGRGSSACSG
ncbi:putative nitrogen assimilation transcription factor [Cercophora samala]|uniref:Nitrogen assimilation transcription factor n=1 Tax=Cercophora samala TaxID=330535 RepID=A0AA39ZLL1_9PEZI|nr:putative nitrogen assimilation transcription factor [Cercophora samala]